MSVRFEDRKSTYPGRYKATKTDGTSEYLTLERADEPTVEGTPLNAATLNAVVRGHTPRNLLDNGEFKIAQAGYMGLHGTKPYVADRWVSTGITSASMGSNGIVLSSNDQYDFCYQKLEGVAGKTVTFAVKAVSFGKFRIRICDSSLSTTYASASIDSGIAICTCTIPTNMNIISLLIYPDNTNATGNTTIEWAALYEGEYTLDTLPEYQPKGYGAELAECQRYFVRINPDPIGNGYTSGVAERADICVFTPVTMRKKPDLVYETMDFVVRANGTNYSGVEIATCSNYVGNMAVISLTKAGIPKNNIAVAYKQSTGLLALSADIL